VANPIEMGSNWPEVLEKLHQDPEFMDAFQAVYPGELRDENIRGAIAEFERSLLTPGSAFDRYLQGDGNALTPEEKRGYALFLENRCATCHVGVILGGLSYEKMGRKADYFQARGHVQEADQGRFNHTKDPRDLHKFKTPTLRNIQVTFPYFHDGSTTDLAKAVRVMQEVQVGGKIPEADVGRIVAFLSTLTGEYQGQRLR
jgi:cytochrome c peroxidase